MLNMNSSFTYGGGPSPRDLINQTCINEALNTSVVNDPNSFIVEDRNKNGDASFIDPIREETEMLEETHPFITANQKMLVEPEM
jgi:hypothetical protein